jgi:PAS domain S-box-containing protein
MPVEFADRLMDLTPAMVVVVATDGRVLRVNEATVRTLGYRRQDVENTLRLVDLHHRPEEVALLRERTQDRRGDAAPVETALRTRGGEVVPTRAQVSLLRGFDEVPTGALHVYEDRREALSLSRRMAELTALVGSLEQRANAAQLLGRAAHELSQPLTAALGQIDLLMLDAGIDPTAAERLDRALAQLDRMQQIVHDLSATAGRLRASDRRSG